GMYLLEQRVVEAVPDGTERRPVGVGRSNPKAHAIVEEGDEGRSIQGAACGALLRELLGRYGTLAAGHLHRRRTDARRAQDGAQCGPAEDVRESPAVPPEVNRVARPVARQEAFGGERREQSLEGNSCRSRFGRDAGHWSAHEPSRRRVSYISAGSPRGPRE